MSYERRGRGRGQYDPSRNSASSNWRSSDSSSSRDGHQRMETDDGWGMPSNQHKRAAQPDEDDWGAAPQSKSQPVYRSSAAADDDWNAPPPSSTRLITQPACNSFADDWGAPSEKAKPSGDNWGTSSSGWDEPQRSQGPSNGSRWSSEPSGNSRIVRVPSGRVGAIIGRGGSKINELQDRSGARIKVLRDDDNGVDAGVQVSGSAEQMDLAERLIEDLTKDHSRSESSGGGGFSSSSSSDLVMKVPSGSVGRIIGRSGAKIHELQGKTGARIKVPREEDNGYEATVRIIGDPEQQKATEALIKELLEECNPVQSSQPVSQSTQDEPVVIDWAAAIANSIEATKAKWAKAPPINKAFYVEDPEVALMAREEVDKFKMSHNNIMTSHYKEGDERPIPNPVTTFKHAFAHYPQILEAVEGQGFSEPSPIQCQAWPILLKGYDLIGIAQTGTGKTLAFLLPALVHIEGQPTPRKERDGPTVLVMAPTRELAQQIEREVRKFPYHGITCVCVYGGGDRRQQIGTVAKGVEIVVATPGRLFDLMSAGALKTSSVSYCVLDEADRMLDLGFEPQIKKILNDVRPDRQMIMTSATWPEGVRRIAKDYMDNPIQVCVGTLDLAAVHSVTQYVEIMAEDDKRQRLRDFIQNLEKTDKAIVFVGRKMVADQIASELSLEGIICQCIHGDRDQIDREQALEDLRDGEVNLLIATDVASRGIDIKDITHILNYDFPRHAEEYVHRVGRTGRAGRTGIAISFMTREDWSKAADLISILEEAGQEVPQELHSMSERFAAWKERKDEEKRRNATDMGRGGGGGGGGGRGCHKCGEEGHFARECPSGGGGGGGGGFGGGFGGRGGGGRGCHKCGEEGHFARECPSGGGGGGGGGRGRGGGRGGGGRGRGGGRRDDRFGDFF